MDSPADWVRSYGAAAAPGVTTLLCLPHAGGAATFFRGLAQAVGAELSVLSIQYPGRQDRLRDPVVEDIAALAWHVSGAVDDVAGDAPLAILGHSMGAMVGWEVALERAARGLPPVAFVASSRAAPNIPPTIPDPDGPDALLLREIVTLGGPGAEVLAADPELAEVVLPSVRADYRAIRSYSPPSRASIACPVVALRGRDDPLVSSVDVARWAEWTSGGFRQVELAGGHFYLDQNLAAVAAEIRSSLPA